MILVDTSVWVDFLRGADTQGGRVREMTLPAEEFIRRFLLHVLPDGFVRIRYYGLLANRHRAGNLARCRELLAGEAVVAAAAEAPVSATWQTRLARLTGEDPALCPQCGRGHLRRAEESEPVPRGGVPGRSPP